MTENRIKKLLTENYPLLAILIGIFLISVSVGPFMNDDTVWEFEAASGVIRWGMPYAFTFGNMMNQPPLGFYVEALFFILFGSSMNNGVVLISLMGLGSIVAVYKIGNNLYDKPTGLVAAGLFALSPWEIILSRTFLIDVQCLFFSLLCLLAGIYSLQKDSVRLFFCFRNSIWHCLLNKVFCCFYVASHNPAARSLSKEKTQKHAHLPGSVFLTCVSIFCFMVSNNIRTRFAFNFQS